MNPIARSPFPLASGSISRFQSFARNPIRFNLPRGPCCWEPKGSFWKRSYTLSPGILVPTVDQAGRSLLILKLVSGLAG